MTSPSIIVLLGSPGTGKAAPVAGAGGVAHADHAVAVENAVPELRAVASEVAGRNDEDGVVRWLAAAFAAGRV